MPYIKPELRENVDDQINMLVDNTRFLIEPDDMIGVANYVITRIVLGLLYPSEGSWRYGSLAEVIATLEAAKLEIYRRAVAPYEDQAIVKNGDVYDLAETTRTINSGCCSKCAT